MTDFTQILRSSPTIYICPYVELYEPSYVAPIVQFLLFDVTSNNVLSFMRVPDEIAITYSSEPRTHTRMGEILHELVYFTNPQSLDTVNEDAFLSTSNKYTNYSYNIRSNTLHLMYKLSSDSYIVGSTCTRTRFSLITEILNERNINYNNCEYTFSQNIYELFISNPEIGCSVVSEHPIAGYLIAPPVTISLGLSQTLRKFVTAPILNDNITNMKRVILFTGKCMCVKNTYNHEVDDCPSSINSLFYYDNDMKCGVYIMQPSLKKRQIYV